MLKAMLLPVVLLSLTTLFVGCGANDHVTAEDVVGGGENLSAQAPQAQVAETQVAQNQEVAAPQEAPLDEQGQSIQAIDGKDGIDGSNGSVGDSGNNGLLGDNGNNGNNGHNGFNGENGKDGKDGKDAVAVVAESTPAPIIIIQKGEDGRNGVDGKNAPILCDEAPRTIDAVVQALDYDQLADVKKSRGENLPYFLSPKKGRYPKIDLLTIGGSNKGFNSSRYVEDAIVMFNAEITLPKRRLIKDDENLSLTLSLDMYKHSVDSHPDTEIVCLLDIQKCSGKEFTLPNWKQMINPGFGGGHPVVNDYFARQLKAGIEANSTKVGGRKEYVSTLTVDLAKLFASQGEKLSNKELLDILYGDAGDDHTVRKELHFAVSDDVMLIGGNRTALKMSYTHDGCAETQVTR